MANNNSGIKIGTGVLAFILAACGIAKVINKEAYNGCNDEEIQNEYTCPECGGKMHFADEHVLVCDECNNSVEVEYYAEVIEELTTDSPTREEVLGCGEDDWNDDEDDSESLSADDAALIWASRGKDEDYTFGFTEDELEEAL